LFNPGFRNPVRRSKYKFSASRKKRGNFLFRFFILALLAAVALLWWQTNENARRKTKSKKTVSVIQTNTAPRPAPAPAPAHVAAPVTAPPVSPAVATNSFPRAVQNPFEAQLALLQYGISSGSLDGVIGSQSRAALTAFQTRQKLPPTGELDTNTRARLLLNDAPYTTYTVTAADLARLQPLSNTWLGKSQQTALDFETILELVSEKFFSHPNLIRRLNPSVDWNNVIAGTTLNVPNASYPAPPAHAAFVTIHLSAKVLEAFDDSTNLLVHFPCSIARLVEKRPVGELHVAVIAPNPNYTFDPEIFPESAEAREIDHKLILPPGPNNPVGVAWIGLDRPGYGIHGTPSPEQVGRTESHGCFRLANWNAEYLLRLIAIGTPVYVEE
jgi:lipoprotein-anchoring transpeptidase ErfK/SrfK